MSGSNGRTNKGRTKVPVTGIPAGHSLAIGNTKKIAMKGKQKGTSAAPKVPEENTGKEFIATGTIGWTPIKSAKNEPKAGAVKWE